jgi:hypothetical protein
MAFRKDTIKVSDTSFAPVGAEVEWAIEGIQDLDTISTIITAIDDDLGTVELCYDETVLPAAVESLSESMLSCPLVIGNCALSKLARLPIVISAGTGPGDISGGAAEVPLGSNIHFWSDSLTLSVEKGSAIIRIEDSNPYDPYSAFTGENNDEDFDPRLVLPRL